MHSNRHTQKGSFSVNESTLERQLKPRHIELIALGGTIGVGLFLGSASTIQMAGPSVLICYGIAGLVMFLVMRIMGEMLYLEPVTGSFATYGYRYLSPFAGLVLLVPLGYGGPVRDYSGSPLRGLLVS